MKRWNPFTKLKHLLGVAVDWRVRDVLEAEREATVALGRTFVDAAAHLTDRTRELEARVTELESRLSQFEGQS
jgi:hypothetical protein